MFDAEREGAGIESKITYNDSSNRVHPIIKVISKENSNQTNDVGDNIKKMILGICFNNFVGESAAIQHQKQFHQSDREHNTHNPLLLIFGQAELILLVIRATQLFNPPSQISFRCLKYWVVITYIRK